MSESRFPAIHPPSRTAQTSRALVPHTPPSRGMYAADDMSAARRGAESEEELIQLKEVLRQQQQRLSSPRQPRRPDGAMTVVLNPVAGQNYAARPYHRIAPRDMWEPSFATDKDVVELADRLHKSEERLETRKREFEVQWSQRRELFAAQANSASPAAAAATDTTTPPQPQWTATGSRPASGAFGAKSNSRPSSTRGSQKRAQGADIATSRDSGFSDELGGTMQDMPKMPSFQVEAPDGTPGDVNAASGEITRDRRELSTVSHRSSMDVAEADIPPALRRRTSSVKVSQGTIAMLRMLESTPDLSISAPKEVGFDRSGDILSERHILKQDVFEAAFNRRDLVGIMSGAPYFRMVPKFHIGGVAQAHVHGIRTALNELRKAKASPHPIVWVCLREEPLVYLNGKSHIIRSREDPLKPQIIANISGARIGQIEAKLKREILAEAASNSGNVCVHHESSNGVIDEQWECVDAEDLCTIESVFNDLNQRGMHVEYRRCPITQGAMPSTHDFQAVVDICQQFPDSPIIFNCQTGRGRSSLMMLVASIVRFYQMCSQDIDADVTLLRGDGKANSFRTLQQLISLLPDGALHERRVAVLMELSDKIYSIADHINASLRVGQDNEKSRMRLAQYAYLLMFSSYCEEYFWHKNTAKTFPQWVDAFNEVKVLVQNISAHRQSMASERIATPQGIAETDEVGRWIRRRRGHVLCSNMILRSAPKEIVDGPVTSVPGVLALRQLAPDVPLFTCGRVSEQGREDLLYNIRVGFPDVRTVVWVSLRAEPMLFINDIGYSLVDIRAAMQDGDDMTASMHVSLQRLEEIEDRLLKDVEQEAAANDGKILLHKQNMDGTTEAVVVQLQSCRTPKGVMDEFSALSGVQYHRVPLPYNGALLASDLDTYVAFLQNIVDEEICGDFGSCALILNDADGGLRTTIALNIASIVWASRIGRPRSLGSADALHAALRVRDASYSLSTGRCYHGMDEEETLPAYHVELQAASMIVQMVAAGSLLKFVDAAIALGGAGADWNLLHAIDAAKSLIAPGDKGNQAQTIALELVRKYLLVLLTAIYIDEQQGDMGNAKDAAFSEWLEQVEEIQFMLNRLEERPQHTLKYIDHRNLMASHVTDDRTIERRSGDVLTANYAMKADHFPGCQKKGLRPQVCGAPNFRKVDNVNVFGVAIPTILGIHNVLSVLGASERPLVAFNDEVNDPEMWLGYATPKLFDPVGNAETMAAPCGGTVVWVNLREEPIIYVGDRPFVFRDLQQPYVNVELTGIEAHKVEFVENTLKQDILREAQLYDGNFLVHDEAKPGEMVGIWEPATEQTIRTIRQVYEEARGDGCRVKFLRLPVTDEQSPELKDFDMLVENLLPEIIASLRNPDHTAPTSFVFNCQMGRGRTTTGMVVCSLLIGLLHPEYYQHLDAKYPALFAPTDSEHAKGNYGCIAQLKSVLADGREAKQRLDLILEACSRMQNLRSAIEGFVVQVSSPDVTEEQRARAHLHGVHYLQRYFNLVAFSSYLHEEYDRETQTLCKTFAAWCDERPELASLHDAASLS